MSDDAKRALIWDEVRGIIEDAIEKISRIVPSLSIEPELSLHSKDSKLAADLIYTHIVTKYFPERAATATADANEKAISSTVDTMETIIRGEIDPRTFLAASKAVEDQLGVQSQSTKTALNRRAIVLVYKEYRKRGISKAEFVRRKIKFNLLTVPKAQRKGIDGTNFTNVYRELGRLLEKERGKAD